MKISEAIKHLERYDPDDTIAFDMWCAEDVVSQATSQGIKLTEEQVFNVLNRAEARFDACLGISWDVLDYHIEVEVQHGSNDL